MSNMEMNSETRNALWKSKRHWNICLHEAGHAVMYIRGGDIVESVMMKKGGGGVTKLGGDWWKPLFPEATIAGHVAELLWGYETPRLGSRWCGSGIDFDDIAREERRKRGGQRILEIDRAAARKTWRRETRKLRDLAKRDPSFERQVKAVAKALSLNDRLTGVEVREIMEAVTQSQLTKPNETTPEEHAITKITTAKRIALIGDDGTIIALNA